MLFLASTTFAFIINFHMIRCNEYFAENIQFFILNILWQLYYFWIHFKFSARGEENDIFLYRSSFFKVV
jgi:hypothetical protein